MADIIAWSPMIVLAAIMLLAVIGGMLPQSEESRDYDVLQRLAEQWRQEGHPDPFAAARLEIHTLAAMEKARQRVSGQYMIREMDPRELAKQWLKEEQSIFASIHGSRAGTQLRKMVQTADPESLLTGRALELYRKRVDETVDRVMKRYAGKPMPDHYRAVYDALRER